MHLLRRILNRTRHDARHSDDGDNAMFSMLHDVDELLLFGVVVRRLQPEMWQRIGAALQPRDTHL